MANRKHAPLLEASEALHEYMISSEEKRKRKEAQALKEKAELEENIYFGTKEKKRQAKRAYSEFSHNLKGQLLSEALTGIYVGAIMESTALTTDGIGLCQHLMDNFIKESGGAEAVLRKMNGKTYALDYIKSVVEGTYDAIMEDADEDNEESLEVDEDKEKSMTDDLNADDDINKAVEVIGQRIADAEEEFVKKNNEDKKALEDIANKVGERIKGVEDQTDGEVAAAEDEGDDEGAEEAKEEGEETVAQESRIAKQKADKVRTNRTRTVFEQVVRNLTESILKDEQLKEEYIGDDGRLDMGSVIESAKCIYGLLETVNTLQIVNVTPKYIQEALSTM